VNHPIPVIDLFAGPGGLSEGFSRHGEEDWQRFLSGIEEGQSHRPPKARFRVALSVEMDHFAHQTLELRALVRKLKAQQKEDTFHRFLQRRLSREELFALAGSAGTEAHEEAWCATLGKLDETVLDARVREGLGSADSWVLIGGPPCQAYSLAGRSRNRGKEDYRPEKDHRHFLYREYLRLVARHRPPIFVMENVKGLLSSRVKGESMFERIREDLERPEVALGFRDEGLSYRLYSVSVGLAGDEPGQVSLIPDVQSRDFIVRMETHGIPQARHRLILLGVRDDVKRRPGTLPTRTAVPTKRVLDDLPALRSGLSRGKDSAEAWLAAVKSAATSPWLTELDDKTRRALKAAVGALEVPKEDRGGELLTSDGMPGYAPKWYRPKGFRFVLNHSARGHIKADLQRYLFVAAYAEAHGISPNLSKFPKGLLPEHDNATRAVEEGGYFGDRFRVQVAGRPSTTVTSHISKDGHYYIHYDPKQCRSLTVREAARLQTFPDDYFFCGPRTEQYRQVGNAVPPLLATQIAGLVAELLA
jgi:DNA (cytosine-5)-methyltransferase 1